MFGDDRVFQWAPGQEEGAVDVEGGMRFTPFNMREEMEEGHFDKEGTYIFKKEVFTMAPYNLF